MPQPRKGRKDRFAGDPTGPDEDMAPPGVLRAKALHRRPGVQEAMAGTPNMAFHRTLPDRPATRSGRWLQVVDRT